MVIIKGSLNEPRHLDKQFIDIQNGSDLAARLMEMFAPAERRVQEVNR